LMKVGQTLLTGIADFETAFGSASSLERDMLTLASAVLAADRATLRGERERFARQIRLGIPVVNVGTLIPLVPMLETVLRRLSNDSWEIVFDQLPGNPEAATQFGDRAGQVLLFSGGLDSLAAAVSLMNSGPIDLVSHITRNNRTRSAQDALMAAIADGEDTLTHSQFFVSSRSDPTQTLDHACETSQRTRSFLFLVLAGLVARRVGSHELVYIAENGQMAIHLPLTQGRIGAFSTHTAHPDVLVGVQGFLRAALSTPISISNPFVHLTKGEVVKDIVQRFPNLVWQAESCWRNARLPADTSHCGECIPCFVRRIAIECTVSPDQTAYARDVWAEDIQSLGPGDEGRRNLIDLLEFIHHLTVLTDDEVMNEWPELYSSNLNAAEVIAMYRRFSQEAIAVLRRYPGVTPLLQ
jgi:7-cyano-7-deazaguanine synthase in queuosine biosynthesis